MANTTIPNKLFDYMAAGLPVVTSDNVPCARIVREAKCGEIFRAKDPGDLALALARLNDPVLRQAEGNAGAAAIQQKYNWEDDAAVLVNAIQHTVADSGGRGHGSVRSLSILPKPNVT
jgi:glycosyltransferase involved in cell wall biosynthesis